VVVREEVEDGVDGIVLDAGGRDPGALLRLPQAHRAQLTGLWHQHVGTGLLLTVYRIGTIWMHVYEKINNAPGSR
jgi:hypothetical protein